jgi:hypothetical protein
MDKINDGENLARMQRGELYYAFTPALIAQRERCKNALNRFNQATIGGATRATRRKRIELWREFVPISTDSTLQNEF